MSLRNSWSRAPWRWAWIPFVAACGGTTVVDSDGGTGGDGGVCVDLDPSRYDLSCQTDADCVGVPTGIFCSGYNCSCYTGTISGAALSQYDALLATVPMGPPPGCSCPIFGTPRCIVGQCVFCPGPFPGAPPQPMCTDGG